MLIMQQSNCFASELTNLKNPKSYNTIQSPRVPQETTENEKDVNTLNSNLKDLTQNQGKVNSEYSSRSKFLSITLGDLLIFLTFVVIAWQTYLIKREMDRNVLRDLYSRWLEIGKLEYANPELHKMLMDRKTYERFKKMSDSALKQRALAWIIFDVFSMMYEQKGVRHTEETNRYLRKVLGNPIIQKNWIDFDIRKAWDGTEFKIHVDKLLQEIKPQKTTTKRPANSKNKKSIKKGSNER